MPGGKCDHCGVDEYMPYVCKFCKGRYCAAHRLPENHACTGLGAFKDKMRSEGRVFSPTFDEPLRPEVSPAARASGGLDAFWKRVDGHMTKVFLGIIAAVYVLEWIVIFTLGDEAFAALFLIDDGFLVRPWTIVTSMFAHSPSNLNHIFVNALVLFFFGSTTERLIGTRRFTKLFLASGAIAGIAQVILTQVLFPSFGAGALGASGAIQGVMGTLVVLAPRLTVLVFFVIPAPLWLLTAFYVLFDLIGAITPGSTTAHFAHLAGLATGVAYGFHLRNQGLRAVVQREAPRSPLGPR